MRPAGDEGVVDAQAHPDLTGAPSGHGPEPAPARPQPRSAKARPSPSSARVRPRVQGPVRKRVRAAENRRRAAARRRGLFWPTAKAGIAVSVVLAISAGLASVLGLVVPAL